MASRAAHVFHDYTLSRGSDRPRREVWYQSEDPVVLPKTGVLRMGGGLVLAALTAGALIAGSAYAVLYAPTPAMSATEVTPLVRDYAPDAQVARANVTNQLSGPAHAVLQTGAQGDFAEETPLFTEPKPDREVVIDDSAPGAQQGFPQPSVSPGSRNSGASLVPEPPSDLPRAPYPSPTMTPPEVLDSPTPSTPSTSSTPSTEPVNPAPTPEPAPNLENPYF